MRLAASVRPVSSMQVGTLLAAAVAGPVATSSANLTVDCPALTGELRSSLEARARAELALKQLSDGRLLIRCTSGRASVEFEPTEGAGRRRDSALAAAPEDIVEQVLALVHEVTTPSEASAAGANGGESPSQASGPVDAPSSASTAAVADTPSSLGSTPPLAAEAPSVLPPRASAVPAPRTPVRASAVPLRLEAGVGVCGEIWAAGPLPLLGPCASFGVRLRPTWRIAAAFAGSWGAAEPSRIAVRIVSGGLETSLGEPLWLAVGARASWLRLTPDARLAPSVQNVVEPELDLRAGYVWGGPRHGLAAALGLRAYAEYRDVNINGSVAFRVPAVALTAALEYRLGLTPAAPKE